MNTTEIITKLRAQAAELTAMADALEATEDANGAGRYLIHGAVKTGDWTTWENVPAMSLVEDTVGDHCYKAAGWRDWVHIGKNWYTPDAVNSPRADEEPRPLGCLDRVRVIALDLTGLETADDIRALVERFKASQVHV